jgi:hypothetical protein
MVASSLIAQTGEVSLVVHLPLAWLPDDDVRGTCKFLRWRLWLASLEPLLPLLVIGMWGRNHCTATSSKLWLASACGESLKGWSGRRHLSPTTQPSCYDLVRVEQMNAIHVCTRRSSVLSVPRRKPLGQCPTSILTLATPTFSPQITILTVHHSHRAAFDTKVLIIPLFCCARFPQAGGEPNLQAPPSDLEPAPRR